MQTHSDVHVEQVTIAEPRCWRCNRKLAELVSSPWVIRCSRCKAANLGGPEDRGASLGAVNERDSDETSRDN